MSRGKRVLFLLSFSALAYLAIFFALFTDQSYYHSGMEFTLRKDGFHVLKVRPESPAAEAGLRPGSVIAAVNGRDARELFALSEESLSGFLAASSRLFAPGAQVHLRGDDGREHRFVVDRLDWKNRFPLLNTEVLVNLAAGLIFVLAGIWLLAIGHDSTSVGYFSLFCSFMGAALASSFFSSYWSEGLLTLRYSVLDAAGVAACLALGGFVRRFPVAAPVRLSPILWISVVLIVLKYLLLLFGLLDPYGPALYFIHLYAIASLARVLVLLARRYREVSAGGRRRLRWITAGLAVSLVPYLVYALSLVFRSGILVNSAGVLNYASAAALLLFPLFVGIGVVRYNLFDIDRFLNRFAVFFLLAVAATLIYSLVFLVFFETALSLELYLTLLGTALAAPGLYLALDALVSRFLSRGRKNKRQILLEMEQELVRVLTKGEIYPVVTGALVYAFDPVSVVFERRAGGESAVEYRYGKDGEERNPGPSGPRPFVLSAEGDQEIRLLLGKKRDEDIYTADDLHLLGSAAAQISKALENCELYRRLQESLANESGAQRAAILSLAKLTEYRDHETGRHLERIQEYSRLLALRLKDLKIGEDYLNDDYIDALCLSSVLHDIGKVGVPDHILLKPGRLDPAEFEAIKQHPLIGGRVLEDAEALNPDRSFLAIGKLVAYHHHERWDGTGYPYGLAGEAIPLSARIVAVADVYDALRSERPYKGALSHEEALGLIAAGSGTQFDPALVDAFASIGPQVAAVVRD